MIIRNRFDGTAVAIDRFGGAATATLSQAAFCLQCTADLILGSDSIVMLSVESARGKGKDVRLQSAGA